MELLKVCTLYVTALILANLPLSTQVLGQEIPLMETETDKVNAVVSMIQRNPEILVDLGPYPRDLMEVIDIQAQIEKKLMTDPEFRAKWETLWKKRTPPVRITIEPKAGGKVTLHRIKPTVIKDLQNRLQARFDEVQADPNGSTLAEKLRHQIETYKDLKLGEPLQSADVERAQRFHDLTRLAVALRTEGNAIENDSQRAFEKITRIDESVVHAWQDPHTAQENKAFLNKYFADRISHEAFLHEVNQIAKQTEEYKIENHRKVILIERNPRDAALRSYWRAGDCASRYSQSTPNSPMERVFEIQSIEPGKPAKTIGYTEGAQGYVIKNGKEISVFYWNSFQGLETPEDFELTRYAMDKAKTRLGVEAIGGPVGKQINALNNQETGMKGFAKLAEQGEQVQFHYNAEDQAIRESNSNHAELDYDSIEKNGRIVLLPSLADRGDSVKVSFETGSFDYNPGKKTPPLSILNTARRLRQLSFDKSSDRVESILPDAVKSFTSVAENRDHKPVEEYYVAVEKALQEMSEIGALPSKEELADLLFPGHINAPDWLSNKKYKDKSKVYLERLARAGGPDLEAQVVLHAEVIAKNKEWSEVVISRALKNPKNFIQFFMANPTLSPTQRDRLNKADWGDPSFLARQIESKLPLSTEDWHGILDVVPGRIKQEVIKSLVRGGGALGEDSYPKDPEVFWKLYESERFEMVHYPMKRTIEELPAGSLEAQRAKNIILACLNEWGSSSNPLGDKAFKENAPTPELERLSRYLIVPEEQENETSDELLERYAINRQAHQTAARLAYVFHAFNRGNFDSKATRLHLTPQTILNLVTYFRQFYGKAPDHPTFEYWHDRDRVIDLFHHYLALEDHKTTEVLAALSDLTPLMEPSHERVVWMNGLKHASEKNQEGRAFNMKVLQRLSAILQGDGHMDDSSIALFFELLEGDIVARVNRENPDFNLRDWKTGDHWQEYGLERMEPRNPKLKNLDWSEAFRKKVEHFFSSDPRVASSPRVASAASSMMAELSKHEALQPETLKTLAQLAYLQRHGQSKSLRLGEAGASFDYVIGTQINEPLWEEISKENGVEWPHRQPTYYDRLALEQLGSSETMRAEWAKNESPLGAVLNAATAATPPKLSGSVQEVLDCMERDMRGGGEGREIKKRK